KDRVRESHLKHPKARREARLPGFHSTSQIEPSSVRESRLASDRLAAARPPHGSCSNLSRLILISNNGTARRPAGLKVKGGGRKGYRGQWRTAACITSWLRVSVAPGQMNDLNNPRNFELRLVTVEKHVRNRPCRYCLCAAKRNT